MIGTKIFGLFIIALLSGVDGFCITSEKVRPDTTFTGGFIKNEINTGILFYIDNNREENFSDYSGYDESRSNYSAGFFYGFNRWNLNDQKREELNFILGVGPIYATGKTTRYNFDTATKLNDKIKGVTLNGEFKYDGRFYYDGKSYALVEVDGFGNFERFQKKSDGLRTTTFDLGLPIQVQKTENDFRLRYGIVSRAGWGIGKPQVVNYLMVADFILDKFYKGQLYSEPEKQKLASEIGRIKNNRSAKIGHVTEKETEQIGRFLNNKMLLPIPESLENLWKFGEFSPRFDGSCFEAGPFFVYYNREPDFIYGGYAKYENNKYRNFHWNRYFKTELSYNRYKTRDWFRWETQLSVDYYKSLRSKCSISLKYIPVLVVNDFNDIQPVQHVFIPSLEYYTELNEKLRMNLAFGYHITENNDFFIKGPEFSLAFYRSRY